MPEPCRCPFCGEVHEDQPAHLHGVTIVGCPRRKAQVFERIRAMLLRDHGRDPDRYPPITDEQVRHALQAADARIGGRRQSRIGLAAALLADAKPALGDLARDASGDACNR